MALIEIDGLPIHLVMTNSSPWFLDGPNQREGTVVAASFLTIVVQFLINHELFHWETYTKKS